MFKNRAKIQNNITQILYFCEIFLKGMFSLYIKELKAFLSSIIGYIFIGVFLIVSGLFIWVFPNVKSQMSVSESHAGFCTCHTLTTIICRVTVLGPPSQGQAVGRSCNRGGSVSGKSSSPQVRSQGFGKSCPAAPPC